MSAAELMLRIARIISATLTVIALGLWQFLVIAAIALTIVGKVK